MVSWTASVLCGLLGAFLWLLGTLLDRSGRIRLRHWAEEANGALRTIYDHSASMDVFRASLTVAAVAALLLLAATAPLPAYPAAATALALLVLAEIAGRVIVRQAAEETLRALTWAYRLAAWVLSPLSWLSRGLLPGAGGEPAGENGEEEEDDASDDEIEAFLEVGAVEGILEPAESELVMRVIDFGDTLVRSVLTPRIDMVTAPVTMGLEDLARLFIETRHSRIPLYRDSVEQIVGILHIRDLLMALRSDTPRDPAELAGEPYFVPDSKAADELLEEMQARRQQMAVVVDEFGATVGLVTIEDLVEELVGEIADEHEELPNEMEPAGGGRWRVDGGSELEVLNRLFQAEVEEEPYETVGGMVFGQLGDVPRVGERVARYGLTFEVESMAGRRVGSLLAWRTDELPAGGEEE